MDSLNYKKLVIRIFVFTLATSAFVGIIVLLGGSMGVVEGQLLASTLTIGGFSLSGLSCSVIYNRDGLRYFSQLGIFVSCLGAMFLLLLIWVIIPPASWRFATALSVLSSSLGHMSLMLLIKPKNNGIKNMLVFTILFIAMTSFTILFFVFGGSFGIGGGFDVRLLGVFIILNALGTITTPLMNMGATPTAVPSNENTASTHNATTENTDNPSSTQ